MSVEPPQKGKPTEYVEPLTAPDPANEPGPDNTSRLRWVFVIVPLVVIAIVGTQLVDDWAKALEQAVRDGRFWPREFVATEKPGTEKAPAITDNEFDAAVVVHLIAGARPEDGAAIVRACVACHAVEKDAPRTLAPSLWGIIDARKAARSDFAYSLALKAKGGTWSYRELAQYLHSPREFAPGTSMAFAGITDNRRIASLLAYLRTLSDNPAPLPK